MLVLSRERNEVVTIGDTIRVIVVEIRGDKVRLGIDAPIDIPVHRQEVADAIVRSGESIADKRHNAALQLAEQVVGLGLQLILREVTPEQFAKLMNGYAAEVAEYRTGSPTQENAA